MIRLPSAEELARHADEASASAEHPMSAHPSSTDSTSQGAIAFEAIEDDD